MKALIEKEPLAKIDYVKAVDVGFIISVKKSDNVFPFISALSVVLIIVANAEKIVECGTVVFLLFCYIMGQDF